LARWRAFAAETFPRYGAQRATLSDTAWFCSRGAGLRQMESAIFEPWKVRVLLKRHGPLVYLQLRRMRDDAAADLHDLLERAQALDASPPNPCLYKGNEAHIPWGRRVVSLGVSCSGNKRFGPMLRRLLEALRAQQPKTPLPERIVVSPCGAMRYGTRSVAALLGEGR
jgi:hypothetical protein